MKNLLLLIAILTVVGTGSSAFALMHSEQGNFDLTHNEQGDFGIIQKEVPSFGISK